MFYNPIISFHILTWIKKAPAIPWAYFFFIFNSKRITLMIFQGNINSIQDLIRKFVK